MQFEIFRQGSALVWVGMSREARTELTGFARGTLTALRFVKKGVTQN